jgi:hypothetical protein
VRGGGQRAPSARLGSHLPQKPWGRLKFDTASTICISDRLLQLGESTICRGFFGRLSRQPACRGTVRLHHLPRVCCPGFRPALPRVQRPADSLFVTIQLPPHRQASRTDARQVVSEAEFSATRRLPFLRKTRILTAKVQLATARRPAFARTHTRAEADDLFQENADTYREWLSCDGTTAAGSRPTIRCRGAGGRRHPSSSPRVDSSVGATVRDKGGFGAAPPSE